MRSASVLLAGLLTCASAVSAEPQGLTPVPDIPPPPGMPDADLEPQITIVQRGGDKIEEFRIRGRLYLMRVTPAQGRPYYLVDTRGDGLMRRYDDLSPNFMAPMWLIHQF